jgi:hypothetical protein
MILLDVVVKFEEDSLIKEMIPQFAATLLAFGLGLYSNHLLYKKSKVDASKKENKDLRLKLRASAENYLLFRIEREQCLSLIKTYGIFAEISPQDDKERYKRLVHEYMLREQDIKLQCHSFHAEMRGLAMSIDADGTKKFDLNIVLFSIQSLTQEIKYDFETWETFEFYSQKKETDRLRKDYSDKVYRELNMHLHSLQEKIEIN